MKKYLKTKFLIFKKKSNMASFQPVKIRTFLTKKINLAARKINLDCSVECGLLPADNFQYIIFIDETFTSFTLFPLRNRSRPFVSEPEPKPKFKGGSGSDSNQDR